ncbi:MAG: hypothetical protein LIO93_08480 [Bacteroidales bacterium]|nr:hypothetical protein [Bacteroidales bacterium]
MWNDNELRQLLSSFVKDHGNGIATLAGTVKDVNIKKCTCTISDDGADYFNVRLKPVTGTNKGLLKVPKKGSHALAVKIEESEQWMLIACSEIDKIEMIVNEEDIYSIVTELIDQIKELKLLTDTGTTMGMDPISLLGFEKLGQRIDKIFLKL